MASSSANLACSRSDSTPIGVIEVLATSAGLYQVNLLGPRSQATSLHMTDLHESELTRLTLQQLQEYFSGKRREFDLPIDWNHYRPFQKEALTQAMKIPFGQVVTYGELAKRMGNPAASRAIGGAMAHNPVCIVIPCHRVVASDGHLTGYSAADGLRSKQWLLELEGHTIVREKLV